MKLISIVVPLFNEAEAFPALIVATRRLTNVLMERYEVEVIFVDDGSSDSTFGQIQAWAKLDYRVVGVRLSRNFGHQFALTCGLDFAKGDAVVSMDADLQDPPEVVEEMVRQWEQGGFDIVYGVRERREGETKFKLWTAALFYKLMGLRESGDFRLMSRRAVDALKQFPERHRLMRGLVGLVGFNETEVRYVRRARVAGKTKYPLRRMLGLALNGVLSFSTLPLQVAYLWALTIAAAVFTYIGYSAVRVAFFGAELVPGWTSTLLTICAFGVASLLCIGLQGEYIGRIFEEGKRRPLYLVRDIVRGGRE